MYLKYEQISTRIKKNFHKFYNLRLTIISRWYALLHFSEIGDTYFIKIRVIAICEFENDNNKTENKISLIK